MVQVILETGLQAIGWAVLKLLTFGRYRGFQPDDILPEGAIGLAVLVGIGYALSRWI